MDAQETGAHRTAKTILAAGLLLLVFFFQSAAAVVNSLEGAADVQQDQVGPKGLELLQHALEIHHAMDLPVPGGQLCG